jgi:hypothetical protein
MLTAGGARGAPFLARQPFFRSGVFGQTRRQPIDPCCATVGATPGFQTIEQFSISNMGRFRNIRRRLTSSQPSGGPRICPFAALRTPLRTTDPER